MLTLLLLRHAKAVPQGGDDFERALTDKGRGDAAALGTYLRDKGLVPTQALVSPSVRTRETLEQVAGALAQPVETLYEPDLYNATARQLRNRFRDVDDAVKTLMIVGHNPGVMELAMTLASEGDRADLDALHTHFPPCSLAVFEIDQAAWTDARHGGRLVLFLTPDRFPR